MRKFAFIASVAIVLGTHVSGTAFAQSAPSVSPPTREEIERRPVTALPPSMGQRVTVEGDIERAPCPLAEEQFASITLTLSAVEFSNLKGVDAAELRSIWAGDVGKTIPLSRVCDIRDQAATILRRKGYLAAVQIPPQRIENGVVRFDVLMAKVVGFQVRGNAGKAEGLISGYLSAIQEQPVFNILEAERYLLLARDIPGYDVRMTLRPAGTVPGEVIGEVQVVFTPVEADLNIQNLGSKETGRFGGLAQVRLNGLFGLGDRTTLGFFSTADFKEQQVVQAAQEFRIGREGLVVGIDGSYAWTRPDLGPAIDLTSRTFSAAIKARYPLIRKQTRNLFVSGGLELFNQNVKFGGVPLTQDKGRTGFVRADFDTFDEQSLGSINGYSAAEPKWRFGASLELRQGFDILGASEGCGPAQARCALPSVIPVSRLEADPTAFIVRGQAYGEYRPTPEVALSLSTRAQHAADPLLSYEEMSGGAFTIGRGYDPGEVTGDSGVGVTGEIRLGSLVPENINDTAIQGYAFADAAWMWNEDLFRTTPNPDKLFSIGGGLRAAFGNRFYLDAGVAVPLHQTGSQTRKGDVRFLINLTVKLLPWKR